MAHLTPRELVESLDLPDDLREASVRHLKDCATCRDELASLKETLAAAQAVDVPEPPPAFWTDFSKQVTQAVSADAAKASAGEWRAAAVAVAAVVAIICAGGLAIDLSRMPADVQSPTTMAAVSVQIEDSGVPALDPSDPLEVPDDDAALQLVADLASHVDWDAVDLAGITVLGPSDIYGDALNQLSADDRGRLQQLLAKEMQRP